MGKSPLAKAVVNDDAIIEKFNHHRYFVRYDDMGPSEIVFDTFINRIAETLGLEASRTSCHGAVTAFLSKRHVLLVLDNGETFLGAAQDMGRIVDAIDGFGSLTSVTIMLTTRSKVLPPNLIWTRLHVPALDGSSARRAFTAIYHADISPATIDKLLSALDFHPLSINLLAQAAVRSEWSPQELEDLWGREKTRLLYSGTGKTQSLEATIELSLNSPSIKRLGDVVRHFLQVVALLPQGVDRNKLTALFPTRP